MRPDLRDYMGRTVRVIIDRPLGSVHPRHSDIIYPINYGYLPATVSGDGMEIDAYLLGITTPITEFQGVVIGIVVRDDDNEDKLIVAPVDMNFSHEQMQDALHFQERFFASRIIATPKRKGTSSL
ncbi:inorganic pyrophosphatase [Reticulibacter mediterranei]|uniref:inorganic diphosphatase n=1 Tax=Reticulibacter mediterranei TaxID=2778369 RepID=A0A8J3ILW4_9CHLR|nr:inorganic diphosphatase [Reticulibacter mediterranei]GHO94835.1 inorganic pyrophosphatase [Reticulibacter mediterranei]